MNEYKLRASAKKYQMSEVGVNPLNPLNTKIKLLNYLSQQSDTT